MPEIEVAQWEEEREHRRVGVAPALANTSPALTQRGRRRSHPALAADRFVSRLDIQSLWHDALLRRQRCGGFLQRPSRGHRGAVSQRRARTLGTFLGEGRFGNTAGRRDPSARPGTPRSLTVLVSAGGRVIQGARVSYPRPSQRSDGQRHRGKHALPRRALLLFRFLYTLLRLWRSGLLPRIRGLRLRRLHLGRPRAPNQSALRCGGLEPLKLRRRLQGYRGSGDGRWRFHRECVGRLRALA
mmetsp:Transcript_41487/g.100740  ORF Transcript_41487/g.100740 Transcript_41487/m.100740 type:complete len:242 (-) Transcript_41487:1024-1749(-)